MTDVTFFFRGWEPVLRILVVGTLMYTALVVLLRVSGSRTIASMNTFDFIVTVALGAAFGRSLTAEGIALVEAVTALFLLVGLQYVVARLKGRWPAFETLVATRPTLLYWRGEFLRDNMHRQRVTEKELRGAARKKKFGSLSEVEAIILEPSGDFSVVRPSRDGSALGKEIERQIER